MYGKYFSETLPKTLLLISLTNRCGDGNNRSVTPPPTQTPVSYTHLDVYKRQTVD